MEEINQGTSPVINSQAEMAAEHEVRKRGRKPKIPIDTIEQYWLVVEANEKKEAPKPLASQVFSAYNNYLHVIRKYPVLNKNETNHFFELWHETGDKRYYEALFNSNLRLVISLTRNLLNQGLESMELIQEGNLGLQVAIERYEHKKGFAFSTYASWWIKQRCQRAIQSQSRLIRIPVNIMENYYKIKRYKKETELVGGVEPDEEEICEALNLTPAQYRRVVWNCAPITSMEAEIENQKSGKTAEFGELIIDDGPSLEEVSRTKAMVAWMKDKIEEFYKSKNLSENDYDALQAWINADDEEFVKDICNKHKWNKTKLKNIQGNAVVKVRKQMLEKKLIDSDDIKGSKDTIVYLQKDKAYK